MGSALNELNQLLQEIDQRNAVKNKSSLEDLNELLDTIENNKAPAAQNDTLHLDLRDNAGSAQTAPAQQGQTQSTGSRVWNTVKGAEKQYAGSSLDTLGSLIEFGATNLSQGGNGRESDAERLVTTLTPEERKAQSLRTAQNVRDTASDITASGQQDIEKAKEGLGEIGQFLVDLGVAGTQLVTDIALGGGIKAASKGAVSAMLPFGTRTFGGATQQAAAEGADINQQIAYGTLDAAKEIAVEKISSVGKIFSHWTKGATDKVVDKAIIKAVDKLAKTDAGKTALTVIAKAGTGAVGEALEEAIGGVIEPYLQKLTYNPDAELNIDDIVYDVLIALPLGALGGGLGSIGSTNRTDSTQQQGNTDLLTLSRENLPQQFQQQGAQPAAQETNTPAAQTEALNSAAVVRTNDTINAIFDSQVGQEYLKQNYGSRAALRQQIRQSNPALSDWQVEIQAAQIVRDGIANTQHETSAQSREAVKIARLAQLPTMEDAAAFQTQNKALQTAQGAGNINTQTAAQNTAEGAQIASDADVRNNIRANTDYAANFSNPQDRLRAYMREPVPEALRDLTGQQAALYNNLNNTEGGMQNGRNALYDEGRDIGQGDRSAGGIPADIQGAAGEVSQGRDTAGGNRRNPAGGEGNSPNNRKRITVSGKTVEITPVSVKTETKEQRELRQTAKKRGVKNVVYFSGSGYSLTDNADFDGLYDPQSDTIYIQADSTEKTMQQLVEHEMYHFFAAKNPKFVQRTLQTVKRENKAAYDELYKKYEKLYGTTHNNIEGMIAEEMFADIFAGAQESELHDAVMQNLPEGIKNIMGVKQAPAENGVAKSGGARFSTKQDILALKDVDWMDDKSSIKDQLTKHADKINKMQPVAVVEYVHNTKESIVDIMMDALPSIGGANMKNSDISFTFDIEGARSINSHATGAELRAAALSAPYVAKYGTLIAGQKNHENTGLTTLTFAAPVIINGSTVNVGLAIQFQANGRPRAVNVELQDGGKFRVNKNEAPPGTSSRVDRYSQGTSLDTRNTSNANITDVAEKSNREFSPSFDSEGRELSAQQKTPRASLVAPSTDSEDLSIKYPYLNLNEDISEMDGIPAIELKDGSVLPIPENPARGHRYTHVEFIEKNRIDVDDLKSGGWIGNGVYEPSFTSDTARYIEQQSARKRVAELTGKPYQQFRFSLTKPAVDRAVTDLLAVAKDSNKGKDTELADLKPAAEQKQGDSRSAFADSVQGSQFLNETTKQILEQNSNVTTYDRIADKDTMKTANTEYQKDSEKASHRFDRLDVKEATPADVALGFILLNEYQREGKYESMVYVAEKLRSIGTASGQTVQMFSILGRMTPEGMMAYAKQSLDKAYEEIAKQRSKRWTEKHKADFELTDADIDFIISNVTSAAQLPDGRDKNIILATVSQRISDKIEKTGGEKLRAFARISMLFNPKTQVRNVLGNATIMPMHVVSDFFGAGIDKAISGRTGVRTAGVFSPNALKGFGKGAFESFDDFRRHINTRNMQGDRFEIGNGKTFSDHNPFGRALNSLDRVTSFMLDFGDRPFYEMWFINSLNNQMRINNATEPTANMIEIATQEALQRTWQDDNGYTKAVSAIRRELNRIHLPGIFKGYGAGDAVMPFIKTITNLAKAMVDFSPVGFVNALTRKAVVFKRAVEKGEATPAMQRELVKSLSQGITGTLMMLGFYVLAAAGRITGAGDDDKDVAAFEKNIFGIQPYSVKIGDKYYTWNWMQPLSGNAAAVANFYQAMKDGKYKDFINGTPDEKVKMTLNVLLDALEIAGDVLTEQSFLKGIAQLFGYDGWVQGFIQVVLNEPAKFTPSISGQIASAMDDTVRTTYVYGNKTQTSVNKVKAKVPVLRETLEPMVDQLGREVQNNEGGIDAIFKAFFNPGYSGKDTSTAAAKEMYRLYKATDDAALIPSEAEWYFTVDGEKYIMSEREHTIYAKLLGGIANEQVGKVIQSSKYKRLDDEGKAQIIKDIYTYAKQTAKSTVNPNYKMTSLSAKTQKAEKAGIAAGDFIVFYRNADTNANGSLSKAETTAALKRSGFSASQQKKVEQIITAK